jgi:hypothetical protein
MKKKQIVVRILYLMTCILCSAGCSQNGFHNAYKGKPFADSVFTHPLQTIPGKIQCEYYDVGGEGIAYHDNDTINSGSGMLNPLNGSYLNGFRKNESVDISYTKSGGVDDNPFNFTEPEMGKLYVGWTAPGEWINYTVTVKKKGTYLVGLMYTANADGVIGLSVNNNPVYYSVLIPSTYRQDDSIAWRQWHHWKYIGNLTEMDLHKGRQVLTLHTIAKGNMNYDYLDFHLKNRH